MIKVMATVPKAVLDEYNRLLEEEGEDDLYGIKPDGVGDCSTDVLKDIAAESESDTVMVGAAYLIEEIRWNFSEKFPAMRKVDWECGLISRQKFQGETLKWRGKYEAFKAKAEAAEAVEPWLVCEMDDCE